MEKKKVLKVEEIKQQYEDAKKIFEELGVQLKIAQQEEEDRRNAQLTLEKANRKKEVDDAFHHYSKLLQAYIKDYGSYETTTSCGNLDWFTNKFFRSFF